MTRAFSLVFVACLAACGDSEASGGATGGSSSSGEGASGGSSAGGGPEGGGGQGGGAGAGTPALPSCVLSCAVATDCSTASPISDADNWECDGECVYLGCNSAEECQEAFMNPNYTCAETGTVSYCQPICNTASDCATPSPATDPDNWACTNQVCEYLGCNSADECQQTFQASNYDCVDQFGLPTCVRTCTGAADCSAPAPLYDEDNWECAEGLCEYQGCNTNQECMETLMSGGYTCQ